MLWLRYYLLAVMMLISVFSISLTYAQHSIAQPIENSVVSTEQVTEKQTTLASSSAPVTDRSAIAADLTTTLHQLPTLNQPIIDSANLLSASDQARLLSQINTLYQQAQAQVGIIIIPTTG